MRITTTLCLTMILFAQAHAEQRPNIIVIFTDDHGYSDLGCQSIHGDLRTPHIDALAAGGVRMDSGYVTAPQCVPSRAGLLSGKYQNRFGVESNGESLDGFNATQTLAERLQKAGYKTGMTGKWHLGPSREIVDHGFQDVFYKSSNRPGWANFGLDGKDRAPGPEDSKMYHLDANSAAACAFIDRHHQSPFFFYCAYRAPHVPLDAPPKYLKRFPGEMPERRRQALAMISAMDDGIGSILAKLREHKLEERTILFFIGDNGAPLKIHKYDAPGGGAGWDGSLNDPLNGEKGMLSEGGIRVPFVVYWKGQIPGGQVYRHPVISLDVAATATALAGLPKDPGLDGINLVPSLKEKAALPERTLYWRWIAQSAIRKGKWKYLRGGAREYLFDLETDREEKNNLAEKHPQIVQDLREELTEWSQDLQPAGLETKAMSRVWEQYYDFYLDGKPAPKLVTRTAADTQRFQGWVVRSADAKVVPTGLQVKVSGNKRPFLARTGLKIRGPIQAKVTLKSQRKGTVGMSWRIQGQDDFPTDQRVMVDVSPSTELQTIEIPIPARERVIHVRLYLPPGESTVHDVKLIGGGSERAEWQFGRQ